MDESGSTERADPGLPEATDAADPGLCTYPGCLSFEKRGGLCVKHLIALAHGDAEAVEARRVWLVTRPGGLPDEPTHDWKQQASEYRRKRQQQKQTGETMATGKKDKGPCRVDGCEKPAQTRGLCGWHYVKMMAQGTPEQKAELETVALPPSRGKGSRGGSLARRPAASPPAAPAEEHRKLERQKQTGKTMATPKTDKDPCRVDGCEKPAKTRGLCNWHYVKMIVRGTPEQKAELEKVALPPSRGKGSRGGKAAKTPKPAPGGKLARRPAASPPAAPAAEVRGLRIAREQIGSEMVAGLLGEIAEAAALPMVAMVVAGDLVIANTLTGTFARVADGRVRSAKLADID